MIKLINVLESATANSKISWIEQDVLGDRGYVYTADNSVTIHIMKKIVDRRQVSINFLAFSKGGASLLASTQGYSTLSGDSLTENYIPLLKLHGTIKETLHMNKIAPILEKITRDLQIKIDDVHTD